METEKVEQVEEQLVADAFENPLINGSPVIFSENGRISTGTVYEYKDGVVLVKWAGGISRIHPSKIVFNIFDSQNETHSL